MSQQVVKILAVSLCSAKKFEARAVWSGEQLLITSITPITGIFSLWRAPLIERVKKAVEDGFVVIVEEKTDLIARYGTQYLLEDIGEEGRSNYYEALDWTFALNDMQNLIMHPDCQQFAIRASGEGSKVEQKQDDKGRTIYNVNWDAFHGGYRTVLLCVVAAMVEPMSERFVSEFCGYIGEEIHNEISPLDRFAAKLIEEDRQRARKISKSLEERKNG